MGPSWGQGFPHILCFSSSLKYLDNSIWCIFPELVCRCENPPPKGRCWLLDDCEHVAPGLLEPKDWSCEPLWHRPVTSPSANQRTVHGLITDPATPLPHLAFFFWPHLEACRILVPWPEIEPRPSAVKVLTTGPPGNSLTWLLKMPADSSVPIFLDSTYMR